MVPVVPELLPVVPLVPEFVPVVPVVVPVVPEFVDCAVALRAMPATSIQPMIITFFIVEYVRIYLLFYNTTRLMIFCFNFFTFFETLLPHYH